MKTIQLLRLISIINSLLIIPACSAQNPSESLLEDVLEDLSVNNDINNSVNTLNWENELEELSNRMQEPVNLNVATREQLEQFPFLSDIQIEHLLAYIYIHGQMKTIYELQLVEEMDKQTIQYLLPFVCIKAINNESAFRWKSLLKNAAKYGKNELLTRFDIPFYRRKGYEHTYLGPSVYNSVKYTFRYRDQLYAGGVAEKDAGEPFGALHNRYGYDYYSFYLLLKDCGRLKALAVGNYRLSFGQGLVISNDFSPSRTAVVAQAERRTNGFRRHFSTNEQDFFQAIMNERKWEFGGEGIRKYDLARWNKYGEVIYNLYNEMINWGLVANGTVVPGIEKVPERIYYKSVPDPEHAGRTVLDIVGIDEYGPEVGRPAGYEMKEYAITWRTLNQETQQYEPASEIYWSFRGFINKNNEQMVKPTDPLRYLCPYPSKVITDHRGLIQNYYGY